MTNKAARPSQMSREEEEGGGKRKREGGRGQGSGPQSQGTLKRLQMECKGSWREMVSGCLGTWHGACWFYQPWESPEWKENRQSS